MYSELGGCKSVFVQALFRIRGKDGGDFYNDFYVFFNVMVAMWPSSHQNVHVEADG